MEILVTGSSGQIGSYVVDAAKRAGHTVRGLDLRASPWTTHVGNILDPNVVETAMRGVDAVLHLAAQISVQGSIEDPTFDATNNTLGTIHLLKHAKALGVQRFVNTSSAAVYGDPLFTPITEDHPLLPTSPYGASKAAAEDYVRMYADLHGLSTISVRPFNVYSIRQDPNNPYSGVLSKFAQRLRDRKHPIIFGDGSQTRDFIHATDVARIMVRLAEQQDLGVMNLGTGTAVSIQEVAQTNIRESGQSLEIEYQPARAGDILHSLADVGRLQGTGIRAEVALSAGLAELLHQTKHAS